MSVSKVALTIIARAFFCAFVTPLPVLAGWDVPFDGSASQAVGYGDSIIIGSAEGAIHAFNRETGEEKWRYQTGEGLTSGPIIIECTESDCLGEALGAVHAGKGSPLRRAEVAATPVIKNDTVYIGSKDDYFYALDARTGRLKWATELDGWIVDEAIVTDQTVFVYSRNLGGTPDVLYALDAEEGEIIWSTRDRGTATYPAVEGNILYFGLARDKYRLAQGEIKTFSLQAVDQESFDTLWSLELNGDEPSGLVFSDNALYIAAIVPYPAVIHFYGVNAVTGNLLWDNIGGAKEVYGSSDFTVGPRHLFFVTEEGLVAVEKTSGEVGWFLEGDYSQHNLQVSGNLYVDSDVKEQIFAIDPQNGQIIWRARGVYLWDTTIADGVIYGRRFALDTNTGKRLWTFRPGGFFAFFKEGYVISASPLKYCNQVIFPTETSARIGMETVRGHLFSIDAETGKLDKD